MNPESPRTFNGPIAEAFELATKGPEPVLVPVPVYTDDRGWSIMNQLQGVMSGQGQINYSVQYPGVVKAWHRHARQTDFWMCVQGHLKVGIHRESDGRSWMAVIGEKRPAIVVIPPPLWHGAGTIGPTPAALLYYLTTQYDPKQPDEERKAWDGVVGFPWGVQFR